MIREFIPYTHSIDTFKDEELPSADSLQTWIRQQAVTPAWLLAHAIDGVIWGWADRDNLRTSHEVASSVSPPLRLETLQQLRLFNADYEIKLWRVGHDNWKAIKVTDVESQDNVALDEQQLLWGTQAMLLAEDFMELKDGSQGLVHIMPLYPPFEQSDELKNALIQQFEHDPDEYFFMGTRSEEQLHRMCLKVRHYLTEDEIGVNSITLSRLTGLGVAHYGQE